MNIDPVKKVIKLEIWYLGYSGTGGKGGTITVLLNYLDEKKAVERVSVPIGHLLSFNNVYTEYEKKCWKLQTHIYSDESELNLYHKDHPISLESVDGFVFFVDSHIWAYEGNLKSWNDFASHCRQLKKSRPPIVFSFHKHDTDMRENSDPMTFLTDINYSEFIKGNIEELVFFTKALGEMGIIASFEKLLSLILSSNGMTTNMKLIR